MLRVVLLLPFLFRCCSTSSVQVSGLFSNELPPPLIYDTFIPVVFEYELPNWKKDDFFLLGENYCRNTSDPNFSCFIYFPFNKEISKLYADFERIRPDVDEKGNKNYFESQNTQVNFCNLIQKHFPSVTIQKDDLLTYYQNLKRCNPSINGIGVLETHLQDYNMNLKQPFSRMELEFYLRYYQEAHNDTGTLNTYRIIANAFLVNTRLALQNTLLSAYYAQKYRWSQAAQDCGSYHIPQSLISSQKFSDTLKAISLKEKFRDLEFTIPLDLISKYYSVPIADCTYTSDSLVVRLQIPVRYKKKVIGSQFISPYTTLQFISLTPAPFYLKDHICSIANINPQHNYIYNNETKEAFSVPITECNSGDLCYAPSIFKYTNYVPCESAILSGNREEFESECYRSCRRASKTEKVIGIITQVRSDQFVLTGKPGFVSIRVKCNSQLPQKDHNSQDFEVSVKEEGAVKISLPCNCYIEFDGRNFYPGSKCRSQFSQTQLTPLLSSKH